MRSLKRLIAGLATIALVSFASPSRGDVVTDWNNVWLDTIRAVGGGPGPLSRDGAIMHVSMYEAANSIFKSHEPYIAFVPARRVVNGRIAAAAAAHRALSTLYPARASIYDAQLALNLAAFPDGAAKTNGIALGRAAADQILASRLNDGSTASPAYSFGTRPGDYIQPDPVNMPNPVHPHWGKVKPWAMESTTQCRPTGPNKFWRMDRLLRTAGYAQQVNEVKDFGKRVSPSRTTDQTEIAWFWANDRNGTYKPPGHLLEITDTVALQEGLSFPERTRLFALVSIGMADAAIVAWDRKYFTDIDLWRPVTAIQQAAIDNNPGTVADPTWVPLADFTPPFPAYTSGHATFGAVHAAIMADFFGTDNITFTARSDEFTVNPNTGFPANTTRTFTSFSQAGRENGLSRIYLGVHFRFDADGGYSSGTTLARYISDTMLRRICAGDFNGNGRVDNFDMAEFCDAYFAGFTTADINENGTVDFTDFSLYTDAYLEGCPAQ